MAQVLRRLKKKFPNVSCALHHQNPIQLMVAVILSAQCTDERVNQVTSSLFKKYCSSRDFAKASLKELEQAIYSTGFFKNKAKNIKLACQKIENQFQGQIPRTIKELTSLNGVGRKTANVILGTAFNIRSGIVVDTHVRRISYRLGFTNSLNPKKIEEELCQIISKKDWIYFSHALILHGRSVCKARSPLCASCELNSLCPKKSFKKAG